MPRAVCGAVATCAGDGDEAAPRGRLVGAAGGIVAEKGKGGLVGVCDRLSALAPSAGARDGTGGGGGRKPRGWGGPGGGPTG